MISDASTVKVLTDYAKRNFLLIAGCGNSLSECFTEIILCKPDILYLDISFLYEHPKEFNVLKQICSLFLLSDKVEEAYNAFEFNAFDYLLRPLDYFRFIKGLEQFRTMRTFFFKKELSSTPDDFFFIKADDNGMKELRIRYVDITFVVAMQNYVALNMEGGGVLTSLITMREMEVYLPSSMFSRIHKSYIVNEGKIASIEGYLVNLINNPCQLQIGNTYRKSFFDKINKRMMLGQRRRIS